MRYLLITLLLILSCQVSPVEPDRSGSLSRQFSDGSAMGCRELAVYFSSHYVQDNYSGAPESLQCEIYYFHYYSYRNAVTDNSNFCQCIVRVQAEAQELAGTDVPDHLDIGPIC